MQQIQQQLKELLLRAGLLLSKWCSNAPEILIGIPAQDLEKRFPLYCGQEHVIKTLGLIWEPLNDMYEIWVHLKITNSPTK